MTVVVITCPTCSFEQPSAKSGPTRASWRVSMCGPFSRSRPLPPSPRSLEQVEEQTMLVDDLASRNFNVTPIDFQAQLIRATGTDGDHRLGGAQGTKGS